MRSNIAYGELDELLRKVDPVAQVREVADRIIAADNPKIFIGQDIIGNSAFETVFDIFSILEKVANIKGGF